MRLADLPNFPKKKEIEEDSIVEQMRGIGSDRAYERGYNNALTEIGDIEVGVPSISVEELYEEIHNKPYPHGDMDSDWVLAQSLYNFIITGNK